MIARFKQAAADQEPLSGGMLWAAAIVLALANFMVIMDMTIANVSIAHIAGSLAVSPTEGAWVITSYAVAEAIIVPLTGWLAARFGTVKTFLACIVIFGVCSALCGLAWSLPSLVLFRIMQGLAGGPLMPLSQTLLRRIFPPEKQNAAIGLWSMTTVVGPIAGPILGGWFNDTVGWPWAFYINVPIAALVFFTALAMLMRYETDLRRQRIDYMGLILLVVWVGALQLMLDKGRELDWFASPVIIGLAVIAVIGFAVFVIWELTEEHPAVDLRLFRSRSFSVGVLCSSGAFGAFFASIVLLPLWLQTNQGYTATWAGYAMAVNGIFAVIMGPIVASVLMPRFDPRILASYGLVVLAAVAWMRGGFTPDIDFFHVMLPQLIQGTAMPFFFIPLMVIAMAGVKPQDMASATGLFNFVRTLCVAFATALTTTFWADDAILSREQIVTHVSMLNQPTVETMNALQQHGLPYETARSVIEYTVQQQATTASTVHIFQATAFLFLIAAAIIWVAKPPKPGSAAPVDAH